jgi:uncharacterized SAM-binding protein YcdF (DUF218 family)
MRSLRLFNRILAAVGLLVLTVTCTPLVDWYAVRLAGPWNDPKGRTLVVLGAEVLGDGTIGMSTYWRALYAARAYRDDGFEQVVVSGFGVAEAMAEFLRFRGVPAAAIHIESGSLSTRENAVQARSILEGLPRPVVLMTSDYHMSRAQRTFAKAGIETLPRPIPDSRKRATDWTHRWSVFMGECVETAKIVYYRVRGWI